MITDIEEYFVNGCGRCDRFATPDCATRRWAEGLAELRRICRSVDLVETVKWGHPCYMHAGRNLVIVGAFNDDFRLSFFEAGLMTDPDGELERTGEYTTYPDMFRFTDNAAVKEKEATIVAYLQEAMTYAEEGKRAPKVEREIEWPDELVEALEADPELAEAFHRLTPGRQRSYAINLNSAKKSATRVTRIQKFRPKILAGKGALDR